MDFCHLKEAHKAWERHLTPGDWVIDATCGNGRDTAVLASLVGPTGGVLALDIQQEALDRAQKRAASPWIQFFHQSHENFPSCKFPIRLIVYNLGYLPGGDKTITTQVESTLKSLEKALTYQCLLSIMLYPGHPEGLKEKTAILNWSKGLSDRSLVYLEKGEKAPSLLLIS